MARSDGEKLQRGRFLPIVTSTMVCKLATFSFFLKKQLGVFYIYKLQNPQPAITIFFKDHLSKSRATLLLPPGRLTESGELHFTCQLLNYPIPGLWHGSWLLNPSSRPHWQRSVAQRWPGGTLRSCSPELINEAHNEWQFGNASGDREQRTCWGTRGWARARLERGAGDSTPGPSPRGESALGHPVWSDILLPRRAAAIWSLPCVCRLRIPWKLVILGTKL